MSNLTLGSLFDGSGGFPLGGIISGITPLWASEVEPFPIRVTTKRIPFLEHLGDVSEIDGRQIPPVDIITFGSPCQDLSIAGKREGIGGQRSGLFYEAVRIVKEMRDKTNGEKPRYIVWENVPGAFSSNKGEDFKEVLQEICSIGGYEADIPRPEKWANAGEIVAEDFSVAWRLLDAQYWGVPQRRSRIYLVADFNGGSAGKVLFESEGLSGDIKACKRAWKASAGSSGEGTNKTGICLNATEQHAVAFEEKVFSIDRESFSCGRNFNRNLGIKDDGISPTLKATGPDAVGQKRYSSSKASFFTQAEEEKANTLVATDYKDPPLINDEDDTSEFIVRRLTPTECARLQGFPDWWCSSLETEEPSDEELEFWRGVFETHRKVITGAKKPKTDTQIRRWLKSPHTDSAEYKMWGNGVALPNVVYVLTGISHYATYKKL